MRGGLVQASTFCFLTVLVSPLTSHASPLLPSSTDAVGSDEAVLLWREPDGVYLQFRASCADCALGKEDAWPASLFVGNTDDLCGNTTISVNGRSLDHSWEGNVAMGSGAVPSTPYDANIEQQAVWSSTCIPGPLGILPRHNARLLTFTFEDNVGFTVLLGNSNKVEILRLSSFPVTVPDMSTSKPSDLNGSVIVPITSSTEIPESLSIEVEVEVELQKLQVLRYALKQAKISAAMQERKLIHLLTRDCMPLRESWRQCENFSCYLKSSWQKLPEIYWSLRYRFGLLGHARAVPICQLNSENPSDGDEKGPNRSSITTSTSTPTSTSYARPTTTDNVVPPSLTSDIATPSMTIAPDLPDAIFPPIQGPTEIDPHNSDARAREIIFPLPLQSHSKKFLRSLAVILLFASVLGLLYRVARHSTVFRQRRRDIASRREELQAQQAYRNAARRLRWRQWWEGRSTFDQVSVVSSYSLPEFQHVRGTAVDRNDERSRSSARYREISEVGSDRGSHRRLTLPGESDADDPPQRMIQAEILGLRRVLEYVGQLVSTDGTAASSSSLSAPSRRGTRSRSRSVPPPYEQIVSSGQDMASVDSGEFHNIRDYRRTALPGLFSSASRGPSSPRASTMFSLETGSLVTLDTLDSLDSETAPPSYHT